MKEPKRVQIKLDDETMHRVMSAPRALLDGLPEGDWSIDKSESSYHMTLRIDGEAVANSKNDPAWDWMAQLILAIPLMAGQLVTARALVMEAQSATAHAQAVARNLEDALASKDKRITELLLRIRQLEREQRGSSETDERRDAALSDASEVRARLRSALYAVGVPGEIVSLIEKGIP